jgi:hypothetical protein
LELMTEAFAELNIPRNIPGTAIVYS